MNELAIHRVTAPVMDENCTVAVLGTGAVVVDPGIGAAPAVIEVLRGAGLGGQPPATNQPTVGPTWQVAIVLTHGHADHLWDAGTVARAVSAAGASVRTYISDADAAGLADPIGFLGPLGSAIAAIMPPELGAGTYEPPDGVGPLLPGPQVLCGIAVTIYPTPGHTAGSVMVQLGQGPQATLCGGDTVFAGSVGRTDLPGGDTARLHLTLSQVLPTLPQSLTLVPGHGPATTLEREFRTNPYLRT